MSRRRQLFAVVLTCAAGFALVACSASQPSSSPVNSSSTAAVPTPTEAPMAAEVEAAEPAHWADGADAVRLSTDGMQFVAGDDVLGAVTWFDPTTTVLDALTAAFDADPDVEHVPPQFEQSERDVHTWPGVRLSALVGEIDSWYPRTHVFVTATSTGSTRIVAADELGGSGVGDRADTARALPGASVSEWEPSSEDPTALAVWVGDELQVDAPEGPYGGRLHLAVEYTADSGGAIIGLSAPVQSWR